MSDWKQRAKKLEQRSKNKGISKAFKQDMQREKEGIQRKKRQNVQAKIREQEASVGDADLED